MYSALSIHENVDKKLYKEGLKDTGIRPWLLAKCSLYSDILVGGRIENVITKHISASMFGDDSTVTNGLFDLLALNTLNDNENSKSVDILTFVESSYGFIQPAFEDESGYILDGLSILTKFSEYEKSIFPVKMNTVVTQNNISLKDVDIFNNPFSILYESDKFEQNGFIKFSVTFNKQDFINHTYCNQIFEKASRILGIPDVDSFTQDFIISSVNVEFSPEFDLFGMFDYNELRGTDIYPSVHAQWWISDVDYTKEFLMVLRNNNIIKLFELGEFRKKPKFYPEEAAQEAYEFIQDNPGREDDVERCKYYVEQGFGNPWYYKSYEQVFNRYKEKGVDLYLQINPSEGDLDFLNEDNTNNKEVKALSFGGDNQQSQQSLEQPTTREVVKENIAPVVVQLTQPLTPEPETKKLKDIEKLCALDSVVFTDNLVSNSENTYTIQHRFGELLGITGGCFPVMGGDGTIKYDCILPSDVLDNTDNVYRSLTSLVSSTIEALFTNWLSSLGDNGYVTDASRVSDIIILQPFNSIDDLRKSSSGDYLLNCVVVSLMYSLQENNTTYIELSNACDGIDNTTSFKEFSDWYSIVNKLATSTNIEDNKIKLVFNMESIKADNIRKYIFDVATNKYSLYMNIPFITILTAVIKALSSAQGFTVHPNDYLGNTLTDLFTEFSAKFYLKPATIIIPKESQLFK